MIVNAAEKKGKNKKQKNYPRIGSYTESNPSKRKHRRSMKKRVTKIQSPKLTKE